MILEKLLGFLLDRSKLVIDKNTEGDFSVGEYNGLYGLFWLPLRISNIGKQATTISYIQLFILNNKKKKLTYGFTSKDIDYKINPGESFTIELGKIIFIRSKKNIRYAKVLEEDNIPSRYMCSMIHEDKLTLENLFAEILVFTPHKRWRYIVPLMELTYYYPSMFVEDFKRVEELDKNFREAIFDELR